VHLAVLMVALWLAMGVAVTVVEGLAAAAWAAVGFLVPAALLLCVEEDLEEEGAGAEAGMVQQQQHLQELLVVVGVVGVLVRLGCLQLLLTCCGARWRLCPQHMVSSSALWCSTACSVDDQTA
jgi:hypothetical protein